MYSSLEHSIARILYDLKCYPDFPGTSFDELAAWNQEQCYRNAETLLDTLQSLGYTVIKKDTHE